MIGNMEPAATLAWFSTPHVIFVLVVVLLLFGGQKLPELARGLARGLRIFKDELHDIKKDVEEPPRKDEPKSDSTQNLESKK